MPVKRYWRAIGLEAYAGQDLELSAFHLMSATSRVDAAATLTASAVPDVSGTLASLQDADFGTSARWSGGVVKTLAITWDFGGSPVDATGIRVSGGSAARFLLIGSLQWSDDGTTWPGTVIVSGITWLGATAYASAGEADFVDPTESLRLELLDASGQDSSLNPKEVLRFGAVTVSADSAGAGAFLFPSASTADFVEIGAVTDFDLGSADFTIECRVSVTSIASGASAMLSRWGQGPATATDWIFYVNPDRTVTFAVGGGATLTSTAQLSLGAARVHVAVSRAGNTLRLFVGGALAATGTHSGAMPFSGVRKLRLGRWDDAIQFFHGSIGQIRITQGRALYTAAFTPSFFGVPKGSVNRVRGRAAPAGAITLGTGPAIVYGTPTLNAPAHLSVESGAVKDQISGMLGQGIGRVCGTVKRKSDPVNLPVARRVRLLRESDLLLVREQWSDPITGDYDFRFVDELQRYTVVAQDHTSAYNAVIADQLVPELMP